MITLLAIISRNQGQIYHHYEEFCNKGIPLEESLTAPARRGWMSRSVNALGAALAAPANLLNLAHAKIRNAQSIIAIRRSLHWARSFAAPHRAKNQSPHWRQ